MRLSVLFAAAVFVSVTLAEAGEVPEKAKIRAVRDVWVCSSSRREDASMSKTHTLKLNGTKDIALIDFVCSELAGRKIINGELFLHYLPSKKRVTARRIGVSTISSSWVEGRYSVPYKDDPVGNGATFNEASFGTKFWS